MTTRIRIHLPAKLRQAVAAELAATATSAQALITAALAAYIGKASK